MSDCSKRAWRVPEQREPGVLYDHGQPSYDYLQARAIVVGGVRFERVRTCRHSRTFNLVKRECDGERYEWHGDELPKRCPNCGAEVVSA